MQSFPLVLERNQILQYQVLQMLSTDPQSRKNVGEQAPWRLYDHFCWMILQNNLRGGICL